MIALAKLISSSLLELATICLKNRNLFRFMIETIILCNHQNTKSSKINTLNVIILTLENFATNSVCPLHTNSFSYHFKQNLFEISEIFEF